MSNIWKWMIGLLVLAVLLLSTVAYRVRYYEAAVVTTFGRADEGSVKNADGTGAGLHWKWPIPIQDVKTYDVRLRVLEERGEEQRYAPLQPLQRGQGENRKRHRHPATDDLGCQLADHDHRRRQTQPYQHLHHRVRERQDPRNGCGNRGGEDQVHDGIPHQNRHDEPVRPARPHLERPAELRPLHMQPAQLVVRQGRECRLGSGKIRREDEQCNQGERGGHTRHASNAACPARCIAARRVGVSSRIPAKCSTPCATTNSSSRAGVMPCSRAWATTRSTDTSTSA